MPQGQSPILALAAGNVVYVILTVVLITLFSQILALDFSSDAKAFIYQMRNVWLLFGAMLGIADIATVMRFLTGGV